MQEKLDVVVAQLEVGRSCVFGGVRLISLAKDYIGLALPMANATELGSLRDDLAMAVGAARAAGAVRVDARLKLVMPSPTEIVQSLKEWGFTKDADRVEFSCAVSELPSDEGTPFAWSNARELQWTKDYVVSFLSQVASGGFNSDVCDHAEVLVDDFLHNQELTCGMSCVHIALFEGKPAGLCVVQINPMNGWSRLSFMGLLPAYRGLGLGQWLHRYGFAVMKREEGAVYHGGTDSNNSPMIRLFLKHKVAKCWDMEEWSWRTEGSPR